MPKCKPLRYVMERNAEARLAFHAQGKFVTRAFLPKTTFEALILHRCDKDLQRASQLRRK